MCSYNLQKGKKEHIEATYIQIESPAIDEISVKADNQVCRWYLGLHITKVCPWKDWEWMFLWWSWGHNDEANQEFFLNARLIRVRIIKQHTWYNGDDAQRQRGISMYSVAGMCGISLEVTKTECDLGIWGHNKYVFLLFFSKIRNLLTSDISVTERHGNIMKNILPKTHFLAFLLNFFFYHQAQPCSNLSSFFLLCVLPSSHHLSSGPW